jgi:hypothetical protein
VRAFFEPVARFAKKFMADRVLLLSSGLAYCAVLSMAPLVIVTLGLVGLVADRESVQRYLVEQMQRLTGADTAGLIDQLAATQQRDGTGTLATVLGGITLLIGATAAFAQLQDGLNVIWNVEPKPGRGLFTFLRKRLLSLAMVASLGFLLLVSLLSSALLAAVLDRFTFLSDGEEVVAVIANTAVLPRPRRAHELARRGARRRRDGGDLPGRRMGDRRVPGAGRDRLAVRQGGLGRRAARVGLLLVRDRVPRRGVHAAVGHASRARHATRAARAAARRGARDDVLTTRPTRCSGRPCRGSARSRAGR